MSSMDKELKELIIDYIESTIEGFRILSNCIPDDYMVADIRREEIVSLYRVDIASAKDLLERVKAVDGK